MGPWYNWERRLPILCQSIITYKPSSFARATPWSNILIYSSWPLLLQAGGCTGKRTILAPQFFISVKYSLFQWPSVVSLSGSLVFNPRKTNASSFSLTNLFPFTFIRCTWAKPTVMAKFNRNKKNNFIDSLLIFIYLVVPSTAVAIL